MCRPACAGLSKSARSHSRVSFFPFFLAPHFLHSTSPRIHRSGGLPRGALRKNPGFVENSLTPEEWVHCRDALRTHRYDAVIVGSGLRLIPDQTAVFEAVVNTIRTLAPATPMLFNEGPGTNIEALERTFGKSA